MRKFKISKLPKHLIKDLPTFQYLYNRIFSRSVCAEESASSAAQNLCALCVLERRK